MNRGLAGGCMSTSPHLLKEDMDIMFATNATRLINKAQAVHPIFSKREEGKGEIL